MQLWRLAVALLTLALGLLGCAAKAAQPSLAPNSVSFRYRFGGEVITQVLTDVVKISTYQHKAQLDQVVFTLKNGRNYVLNADLLVDYTCAPGSSVEREEFQNVLYNHYDPYMQAEKQELHRIWVNEQYLQWVGRSPTDAEWLAALNELTRGVEHYQMERWIQYSPPACSHFVTVHAPKATAEVTESLCQRIYDGASYAEIEKQIASDPVQ